VLPKGAGAVRCDVCGAEARADGKGSPIILWHAPGCKAEAEFRRKMDEKKASEE
jgi:hypothetical protein